MKLVQRRIKTRTPRVPDVHLYAHMCDVQIVTAEEGMPVVDIRKFICLLVKYYILATTI